MALAPEKRRKNTAAKQLPSWLRPAAPTLRKILLYGPPKQKSIVLPLSSLRLFIQLPDDCLTNDHWNFTPFLSRILRTFTTGIIYTTQTALCQRFSACKGHCPVIYSSHFRGIWSKVLISGFSIRACKNNQFPVDGTFESR